MASSYIPLIREAFGPQHSPRTSLPLLKVDVCSGTGGITRFFPGFLASLDCPLNSMCVISYSRRLDFTYGATPPPPLLLEGRSRWKKNVT